MHNILLVAIGGALGSVIRFLVNNLFSYQNNVFPKSTFIVNIVASLLLGLITGLVLYKLTDSHWLKYFIAIGFCGGFSTFSTFALELYQLQENGNYLIGIGYALLSIIISITAIFIGILIIKNLI